MMRIFFLILAIGTLSSSCEKKRKNKNDFSFYLPEAHLYFTTSKRMGGKFYVMMSKTDKISKLSDSVDYIECNTEDGILVMVLDPNKKDSIHFVYPWVKKINQKKLHLIQMKPDEFTNKFYHKGATTDPDILKRPYKELLIAPMHYRIIFLRDSIVKHQKVLKDGSIWGE